MVDPVGLFIVNPLSVSPRNRVRTETRAAFAERLPPDRNCRAPVPSEKALLKAPIVIAASMVAA